MSRRCGAKHKASFQGGSIDVMVLKDIDACMRKLSSTLVADSDLADMAEQASADLESMNVSGRVEKLLKAMAPDVINVEVMVKMKDAVAEAHE